MASSGRPRTVSTGHHAVDALVDGTTRHRRVRHIASLHIRNFVADDSQDPALHHLSLSMAASPSEPPVFFSGVTEPCVHADWPIDACAIARGQATSSSAPLEAGIVGQQRITVGIWAKAVRTDGDTMASSWSLHSEQQIDLTRLEKIPGGLHARSIRRLPRNAFVVGLRETTSAGDADKIPQGGPPVDDTSTDLHSPRIEASDNDSEAVRASRQLVRAKADAQNHDAITYYLVPDFFERGNGSQGRKARAMSLGSQATYEAISAMDTGGAISDPEEVEADSDQEAISGAGGYDSETSYELGADRITERPSLNRRRSSSWTIRALRRDRERRVNASTAVASHPCGERHDEEDNPALSATGAQDGGSHRRRLTQRQSQRDREREVLERSKRETRMLRSYNAASLRSLLTEHITASTTTREGQQYRQQLNHYLWCSKSAAYLARREQYIRGQREKMQVALDREQEAIEDLRLSIRTRTTALVARKSHLAAAERESTVRRRSMNDCLADTHNLRREHADLSISVHNRRAHLLEAVSCIFPIELVSPAELLFTIGGLQLPNAPATAVLDPGSKVDEEEIAASLGLAAQVTLLLSSYLETPLHYEVAVAGSRAMMRDGISIMNGPRNFPLYSRAVETYRFEYAVFLLNKNIEQMLNEHSLPVLDLGHILPNLNNLVLTLSSPVARPPLARQDLPADSGHTIAVAAAAKRPGYRLAGKREIVLASSSTKEPHAAHEVPGAHRSQGDANGERQQSIVSPAASWTASLLKWTSGSQTSPTGLA
ncbi:unnamed protein product [Parajaminaea phylloscopi]